MDMITSRWNAVNRELNDAVFRRLKAARTLAERPASYRRIYESAIRTTVAGLPTRTVALRIDDEGLHESCEGVRSFAPWSSVVSYGFTSDTLLIRLSSGHWSLIPLSALEDISTSLTSLESLLESRGIKRVTA